MGKDDAKRRYGEEAVGRWQSGFRARPPAVGADDPRHPGNDPRYARLRPEELPPSESLEDVLAWLLPHWSGVLASAVEAGGRVLVVAHGNSLRALVKHLDGLSDEEAEGLGIPPSRPLVYEFDGGPARRYDLGGQSQ